MTPTARDADAWPRGVRWLHWLGAALVFTLIAIGLTMAHADIDVATKFDLYQWHKSFGFTALALTVVRIAVRSRARRPDWPAGMRGWEIALARATHGLFYALLVALPLIGWIMVSAAPLPLPTVLFDAIPVPHLMGADERVYEAARLAHRVGAWTFCGLILLHVAAALKHHLVDRDAILRRMVSGCRLR